MKNLILVALGLLLTGCAAMEKDYQQNSCNYDGGYQIGVNHAQSGKELNAQQVSYLCTADTKEATNRGYREGYMAIKNTPSININMGSSAVKKCMARPGQEVHQGFCSSQNASTCNVHSPCMWN